MENSIGKRTFFRRKRHVDGARPTPLQQPLRYRSAAAATLPSRRCAAVTPPSRRRHAAVALPSRRCRSVSPKICKNGQ